MAAFMFVGLLFLGFSPMAIMLTTTLLALQWAVGVTIARMLLARPLTVLESMSFGGVLGLSAVVVARQLVVNLPSPRVLTVVVLATVVVVAGVWQPRFRPHALLTRHDQQFLMPVAGLSLLQVAPGLTWPSLAGLTCMAFASQSMRSTDAHCLNFRRALLALGYITSAVVLAVVILGLDSIWSGSRDQDSQFFESLGILVARFGVDAGSPTLAGQSIAKYHWLASGWIGTVNDLSGASPYMLQTQIAPFVNGLILFSSVIGIAETLGVSKGLSVLVAGGMLGMGGTDLMFYSQSLSLAATVALLHFGVTHFAAKQRAKSRLPWVLGMTFLGVFCFFAKATSLIIAVSVLLACALIQYLKNPRISEASLWATALMITLGTFLATYVGSPYGSARQPRRIERLSVGGIGGLNEGLWLLRSELGALLSPFALLVSIAGTLMWARYRSNELTGRFSEIHIFLAITAGFGASLTASAWLIDESSASGTLIACFSFTVFLSACLILASFVSTNRNDLRRDQDSSAGGTLLRQISCLLVIFAGLGLVIESVQSVESELWGTAFGRDGIGRWFIWLIFDNSPLFVSILCAFFMISASRICLSRTSLKSGPKSKTMTLALLSASLVFTVCTSTSNWIDKARYIRNLNTQVLPNTNSEDINLPASRSPGLRELGDFVRRELPRGVVLASNNFCCFGESWIDKPTTANSRAAFGGANFQLSAETQRRFLAQGLLFGGAYYRSPPRLNEDEERRLRLSLSFANSPSLQDLTSLREFGVTHFIVNLQLTDHLDWSEFGSVIFRVDEFIIIELK